jgi:uncharacterized membrane protein HdeD (DUF308 family)
MAGKILMNERDLSYGIGGESANPSRWLMAVGIAILGGFALAMSVVTTLVSVLFIGGLFSAAAIFQAVFAATSGRWSGFGLHLMLAALYGVAGVFLIVDPAMGARSLTLLLASFFIASGSLRMVGASAARFSKWGWAFFSGLVTIALGIYILANLPAATPVMLGVVLGVDLLFLGTNLAVLGSQLGATVRVLRFG